MGVSHPSFECLAVVDSLLGRGGGGSEGVEGGCCSPAETHQPSPPTPRGPDSTSTLRQRMETGSLRSKKNLPRLSLASPHNINPVQCCCCLISRTAEICFRLPALISPSAAAEPDFY